MLWTALIGDFKFIEVNRQIEHLCELLIVTAQGGKNRDDKDGLTLTQKHTLRKHSPKRNENSQICSTVLDNTLPSCYDQHSCT